MLYPFSSAFAQGSLTPPPGAPAASFKSLQQIEPRTDLQATPVPAGVDASNAAYEFIISQPGSYYLSANLAVSKTNGIQINAEGVSLDLNGFQLSRGSGSGGNGIEIVSTAHRASIRNGSVKGFQTGIQSTFTANRARGSLLRDLAVSGCTLDGIVAGESAVLDSCRAYNNSGDAGILSGPGCSLTNCTAGNNTSQYGMNVSEGTTMSNCTVYGNNLAGIGFGIHASFGSSLLNCSARNNTGDHGIATDSNCLLMSCSAVGNSSAEEGIFALDGTTLMNCIAELNSATAGTSTTGIGIRLGDGCTIQNCTAKGNTGDGIHGGSQELIRSCTADQNQGSGILVVDGCLISDCVANRNGKRSTPNNATADGIQIGARNRIINCTIFSNAQHGIDGTSSNNRNYIEGCLMHSNTGFAIFLQAAGNTVIKNQVGGNGGTINVAGANVAPIQDASTAAGTMHPLANFP